MSERTFRTTLIWHGSTGSECEANVRVSYAFHRGYKGDRTDPPEADSVEIVRIVDGDGKPVPERFLTDDDLLAKCMQDAIDDAIAAEEYRAECRRDDLMMERF